MALGRFCWTPFVDGDSPIALGRLRSPLELGAHADEPNRPV